MKFILKKWKQFIYFCIPITIILSLTACTKQNEEINTRSSKITTENNDSTKNPLKMHFIDVGQGDSTLIESNGQYMLIDAGDNKYGETVVKYLQNLGVTSLKYVIGTHPDSDHIGGLDNVILNFDIETLIMPSIAKTTLTFESVIQAIEDKNLKITSPSINTTYNLGNSNFTIVSPNSDNYSNTNNYSVGIHLTYGKTALLACGDIEKESQDEILDTNINISSTILKCSHHGSYTGISEDFLNKVNPKIAIISVGKNNKYGHPHKETLNLLEEYKCNVLRTDILGTIILSSNGESIEILNNNIINETTIINNDNSENEDIIVYKTDSGKKYHKKDCVTIKNSQSKTAISNNEAIVENLEACKQCNP